MLLLELFKSVYKYTYQGGIDDGFDGTFKTDDKHDVNIHFVPNSFEDTDEFWEVEFGRWAPRSDDYAYGVNSKGDAYKIFATIIEMLLEMVNKAKKPEWVMFTAEEESRKKLYNAFVKRFTRNETYTRVTSGKMYTAIKKNYKTNEVFLFHNSDHGDPS